MTFLVIILTHMLNIFHLLRELHAHGHLSHLFLHINHLLLLHTHHLFLHIELFLSFLSHLRFFLVSFLEFIHIHFVLEELVLHLSSDESLYIYRGMVRSSDGGETS